MSKDLATREGALAFLEHTKGALHGQFARSGEIRPHAIVFIRKSPDGETLRGSDGQPAVGVAYLFAEQLANNGHKDAFASVIAGFVERTHGCGVLMVMEAWSAIGGTKRSDFPADLSVPFPGRREGIWLALEHVALERPVHAWSPIERSASGKGYPGPFEDPGYGAAANVTGRFANLFKGSAS